MLGIGLGEYTLGGFKDADSRSVGSPLVGILSDPTSAREFLLRATPKDASGNPVLVDVSSSGYQSQPTDSPYKQFPSAIKRPYNFSASLPLPEMSGSLSLGIGDIEINNADAEIDSSAILDWLAGAADVYLGPKEPSPLTQFTRIFKGTTAGVSWTLDKLSILHRDLRFRLQKRLNSNRYLGLGSCGRYNGTSSVASGAVTSPTGAMSIICFGRRNSTVSAFSNLVTWYDGVNVAGIRSIQMGGVGANLIRFIAGNDAGVLNATSTIEVPSGDLVPIGAVLDIANSTAYIYVYKDGAFSVGSVALTGTFNTTETTVYVGSGGAVNFYPGDIDEVAIFNTALSASTMKEYLRKRLTGSEANLTDLWRFNEGTGTTAGNSIGARPSLTMSNVTWVGSLEGDTSLEAVPKPRGLGVKRQIVPRLVDAQRLVYQVNDGSMQNITAVRDSADVLTFGSSLSDPYASAPSAGTWNKILGKGLFRLGSTPVGEITCDIEGDNSGSLGYVSNAPDCHRKLITQWGGLDNVNEIDSAAYATLKALPLGTTTITNVTVGYYWDSDINIDQAADEIIKGINCWGGPTRTALMTVGRIDDPQVQSPTVAWTEGDLEQSSQSYTRNPMGLKIKEVIVGYRKYGIELSPDQIAGVVTLANRDDFGKEYRYVKSIVVGAPDDADTVTILTDMDSATHAQGEADRVRDFLSRQLDEVKLSLDSGTLFYWIGTIVSLLISQKLQDGTTIARYNTTGGKRYVVVGISEDMGEYGASDRLEVTLIG